MKRSNRYNRAMKKKVGALRIEIPNLNRKKFYGMIRNLTKMKTTVQTLMRSRSKTKISIQMREFGLSIDLKN